MAIVVNLAYNASVLQKTLSAVDKIMRPKRWEVVMALLVMVPLLTGQWGNFASWLAVITYGAAVYGFLILMVAPHWFVAAYRYLSGQPHTDISRHGFLARLSRWL